MTPSFSPSLRATVEYLKSPAKKSIADLDNMSPSQKQIANLKDEIAALRRELADKMNRQ
jgi:hypothetical protein